jgi:uncharacterized protein (DUF1697 family)
MRNEKLRGLFEELGFTNVRTVISSGNVLFESSSRSVPGLESVIEKALPEKLGFFSTVIIRSDDELDRLVRSDPFGGLEHSRKNYLTVTFFKKKPTIRLKFPVRPAKQSYRLVGMHDRAVFGIVDVTGAKTPDFMVWLEKTFGKEITTRTWLTVGRILARF